MLGFIKKIILTKKQNLISRRFPNVNIVLHPDLSSPSIDKMVKMAKIVNTVNSLEPKISSLSDTELKQKTQELKEHISNKSKVYDLWLSPRRKRK